jgi:RNA-directed DNA polymerase
MASITARVVDRAVLSLLKQWLRAPVRGTQNTPGGGTTDSGGKQHRQGTPQGGVISPLLANRYMNRLLRYWEQSQAGTRFAARIVNYADDFVIVSKGKAHQAYVWVQSALRRLGLTLNPSKSSICEARREHFDFLATAPRFGSTQVFAPACKA